MTAYEKNDTMRLMAQQYPFRYMTDENMKCLHEILDARGAKGFENLLFDIVMDVFLFGVIVGKRSDRARRATKKAVNPTTK